MRRLPQVQLVVVGKNGLHVISVFVQFVPLFLPLFSYIILSKGNSLYMKKRYLIGILLSVVLLVVLLRKIDFHEIWFAIKGINYWWFLVWFAIYPIAFFIKAYRWRMLFGTLSHVPLQRFLNFFMFGLLANNIIPLRIGEVIRAYLLGKKLGISKSASIGTVVVERVFDVFALLVWFAIFLVTASGTVVPVGFRNTGLIMLGACIAGLVTMVVVARNKDACVQYIHRIAGNKLKTHITKIDAFFDGLAMLKQSKHIMIISFLSMTIWFLEAVSYFIMGQAFGFTIGMMGYMFVLVAICLGLMLPSGPGYIGVYEATCVGTMVLLGVTKSDGLAYALVIHALQTVIVSSLGIYAIFKEGLSFRDISMAQKAE